MSEEVVKSLLYKDIVLVKKGSGIGVKNDIWLLWFLLIILL